MECPAAVLSRLAQDGATPLRELRPEGGAAAPHILVAALQKRGSRVEAKVATETTVDEGALRCVVLCVVLDVVLVVENCKENGPFLLDCAGVDGPGGRPVGDEKLKSTKPHSGKCLWLHRQWAPRSRIEANEDTNRRLSRNGAP